MPRLTATTRSTASARTTASARSANDVFRVPQTLLDLATNMWTFGTGHTGDNSAYVQDVIGSHGITFNGGTALSTVYTANEYTADLDDANQDYYKGTKEVIGKGTNGNFDKLSMFCWAEPDNASAADQLMGSWDQSVSGRGFQYRLSASRGIKCILSSNGNSNAVTLDSDNDPVYTNDQWASHAFVFDGSAQTFKVYINGVETPMSVISGTIPTEIYRGVSGFIFGTILDNSGNPSLPYDGKIGIPMANTTTAWTDAQVLEIHNITNQLGQYV